jgi:thiamine biosynthesis lipoprotein
VSNLAKRFAPVLLAPLTAALLSTACTPQLATVARSQESMGTVIHITAAARGQRQVEEAVEAAFAEFRRLDGLLSHYSDSSEVGRLNRKGRLESPSPELQANIRKSVEYGRLSGGAFDITVQPILDLYDHTFRELKRAPTAEEVQRTLRLVDYRRIELGEGFLRLGPGQKITLGGIAKGYAVDRALAILRSRGVPNALVDGGGDIRAMGRAEGRRDWLVALRNPRDPNDFITRIRASDLAVLTSGDYERYYDPEKKFHHIINPLTGYSATELISVTIVGPAAFDADALATAVFVLGLEKGMKMITSLEGYEGLLITRERRIHRTPGFARYELP